MKDEVRENVDVRIESWKWPFHKTKESKLISLTDLINFQFGLFSLQQHRHPPPPHHNWSTTQRNVKVMLKQGKNQCALYDDVTIMVCFCEGAQITSCKGDRVCCWWLVDLRWLVLLSGNYFPFGLGCLVLLRLVHCNVRGCVVLLFAPIIAVFSVLSHTLLHSKQSHQKKLGIIQMNVWHFLISRTR